MTPPDQSNAASVYNAEFSENYMVGNIGMLDAICSTWFGTPKLYVHMINFIPLTSVTGELFKRSYVSEEYENVLAGLGEVEMAWRGFVVADHAIIDPTAAWKEAQDLFSPTLDAGLSKSQVLYWIATREGFNATNITSGDEGDQNNEHESNSTGDGASCSAHAGCSALGLTGSCCPTLDGT